MMRAWRSLPCRQGWLPASRCQPASQPASQPPWAPGRCALARACGPCAGQPGVPLCRPAWRAPGSVAVPACELPCPPQYLAPPHMVLRPCPAVPGAPARGAAPQPGGGGHLPRAGGAPGLVPGFHALPDLAAGARLGGLQVRIDHPSRIKHPPGGCRTCRRYQTPRGAAPGTRERRPQRGVPPVRALPCLLRRKNLVKYCSPEMCSLTEQVVFTDPYHAAPINRHTSPQLDADIEALRADVQARVAAAELKARPLAAPPLPLASLRLSPGKGGVLRRSRRALSPGKGGVLRRSRRALSPGKGGVLRRSRRASGPPPLPPPAAAGQEPRRPAHPQPTHPAPSRRCPAGQVLLPGAGGSAWGPAHRVDHGHAVDHVRHRPGVCLLRPHGIRRGQGAGQPAPRLLRGRRPRQRCGRRAVLRCAVPCALP